ncbi:MAG TPA: sigma-70 family RNA polymerase sigma factor [Longimicrobiaceae bacterium]|nr:sigma-70 family RNA polymerase sigma factor [Longimicrobiaceae bacterium]
MTTASAPAAPDRALAEALLLHGDERAFRELYRRHTPRLYQLVLRMLGGSEHDAEDVVQEAWIRATEALGGFRWESAFATWLTGIGINVARGLLRRQGKWGAEPPEGLPEPWRPPPADGERIDLERAIALLPAGYRAVLVLHDVEGYKHEEIGERLGISPGTSKSQLCMARRSLRRLLEPAPRAQQKEEKEHEPAR